MPDWTELSYKGEDFSERILVYPLSPERYFDFSSPKFSTDPRQVKFLGVFDPEDGSNNPYDFIMGSEEGSGAFSMPAPTLVMPFRYISETATMGERIENDKELYRFVLEFVIDRLGMEEWQKEYETGVERRVDWLLQSRMIRPYDDYFVDEEEPKNISCGCLDILELKRIMYNFREVLMDDSLPEPFRQGVDYITSQHIITIAREIGVLSGDAILPNRTGTGSVAQI